MDMLTLALEVNIKKAVAKTIKIEMGYLCERIAAAYEIDLEDLKQFIEEPSENIEEIRAKVDKGRNPRPVAKKPAAKKEKKDSDTESASGGDRQKCAATTAKGTACKNNALAGKCYCHAHKKLELPSKVVLEESDDEEEPPAIPVEESQVTPPPPKAKGKGKGKAASPPPAPKKPKAEPKSKAKGKGKAKPEHNHETEQVDEGECSRCAEHGHPNEEGEFTVDSNTKQKLEDILAALEAADMEELDGDK